MKEVEAGLKDINEKLESLKDEKDEDRSKGSFEIVPSRNSEETLSIMRNDFKKAPMSGSLTEFRTG